MSGGIRDTRAYASFCRLADELATLVMILIEKQRGFSRTGPGDPPTHEELLAEVRARPPAFTWPGSGERLRRGRMRVPVSLPSVDAETFFDLFPARGEPDTLVVYHHGLGEIPHDSVVRSMRWSHALSGRCDMVAIKGLHHEHHRAVSDLIASREVFVRALVASAALAREIGRDRRPAYRHLVMCGTSMGGVITLMAAGVEHLFDLYVPFVAGPDLADVMLRSVFSRLIQGAWLRQARRSAWVRQLDLTPRLRGAEGPPIRPLLGRNDPLFRFERQLAAYRQVPRARLSTFAGGHLTTAVRVDLLARHLLRNLDEVCWSARQAPALVGD